MDLNVNIMKGKTIILTYKKLSHKKEMRSSIKIILAVPRIKY